MRARLRAAVAAISPWADQGLVDEAVKLLLRTDSQNPIGENYRVHKLITEGVPVEDRDGDGRVRTSRVWLADFEHPANNYWVALNPFTIVEDGKKRRPDILVYLNGIPVGLSELKSSVAEHVTLKNAWNQV